MAMPLEEQLEALDEYKPVIVSGGLKDPFQTRIVSNAGEIYIWDEAMEVTIDGVPETPEALVRWLARNGPTEITFSYDGENLNLELGTAHIRVRPLDPESLNILTPRREMVIF